MTSLVQNLMPYGILVSHVVFVIVLLAIIFRHSWGKEVSLWVGKHAVLLGFIVALSSVLGSLFYSEIVGFPPCVLCWWQRVFIYPQVLLFLVALWKGKRDVFLYSVPMVSLSSILALYHEYVYMGGTSILPCTALGGACAKIYVLAFGYITIPMMSLTAAALILLLAWANKVYENRNA